MRAIPHFRALDGVRGVAALLVAVYHCWVLTGYVTLDDGHGRSVLGAGYVGVDVFFVLSGFVLFVPMASHPEHPVELRSYARRRAARIVPAYLLALSVAIVFNPWVSLAPADLPWQSWAGLRSLVAHLLFLHQLLGGSTDQTGFGAVGSVWTLSLEASFYLLLPFVARPFLRRPLVGVTVGLSAAAAWRAFVMHVVTAGTATVGDGFVWGTQLPTYLGHFALGMGGAVAVVHIRTCPRWRRAARSLAPVVTLTTANQLIYNGPSRSTGSPICQKSLADAFYFHPEHRHWHLKSVNRFSIYRANDAGSGGDWNTSSSLGSLKESFCLLDWVKMNEDQLQMFGITLEPSVYNCFFQGISRGWFDYYHHSTDGQFIDITGAPPGIYYLVLDANPDQLFLESNYENNRSWISFRLRYVKTNNAVVEPLFNSFTQVGEGLEAPSGTNR